MIHVDETSKPPAIAPDAVRPASAAVPSLERPRIVGEARRMSFSIPALLRCMRPREWVKNLLLFAGVIFSESLGNAVLVEASVFAFGLFCLAASAIYLLNDLVDMNEDRRHPVKRNRPLPSGRLDPVAAMLTLGLLATIAICGAFALHVGFGVLLLIYLVMNVGYSLRLKHIVILDVMLIAVGFVLRAVAGAVVIGVSPSPWLVLCTLTLALLVGFGKRRHELSLLGDDAKEHRSSLAGYSITFLDSMMTISAAAAVVCYALYSMSSEIVERHGRYGLAMTIPFVLFGIFRYLYLVHQKKEGGDPAKAFVSDVPTVVNGGLWVASACVLIYAPQGWLGN